MLTACAASQAESEIRSAPDPVVRIERVEVRVCPPEVLAEIPAAPTVGADAVLRGNESGFAYLRRVVAHTQLLAARLVDAREECR